MIKLSMFVIYAILAFNITAFATILQLDMLIFNSVIAKLISWLLAAALWIYSYRKRNVFITLF